MTPAATKKTSAKPEEDVAFGPAPGGQESPHEQDYPDSVSSVPLPDSGQRLDQAVRRFNWETDQPYEAREYPEAGKGTSKTKLVVDTDGVHAPNDFSSVYGGWAVDKSWDDQERMKFLIVAARDLIRNNHFGPEESDWHVELEIGEASASISVKAK